MSNARLFMIGVVCCLFGMAMIYVGDHRHGAAWVALVAIGVAAVVLGIGVLRYLLMKGLKRKGA
jgi:hypothetical protein